MSLKQRIRASFRERPLHWLLCFCLTFLLVHGAPTSTLMTPTETTTLTSSSADNASSPSTTEPAQVDDNSSSDLYIGIGIVAVLLVISVIACFCCFRRKQVPSDNNVENVVKPSTSFGQLANVDPAPSLFKLKAIQGGGRRFEESSVDQKKEEVDDGAEKSSKTTQTSSSLNDNQKLKSKLTNPYLSSRGRRSFEMPKPLPLVSPEDNEEAAAGAAADSESRKKVVNTIHELPDGCLDGDEEGSIWEQNDNAFNDKKVTTSPAPAVQTSPTKVGVKSPERNASMRTMDIVASSSPNRFKTVNRRKGEEEVVDETDTTTSKSLPLVKMTSSDEVAAAWEQEQWELSNKELSKRATTLASPRRVDPSKSKLKMQAKRSGLPLEQASSVNNKASKYTSKRASSDTSSFYLDPSSPSSSSYAASTSRAGESSYNGLGQSTSFASAAAASKVVNNKAPKGKHELAKGKGKKHPRTTQTSTYSRQKQHQSTSSYSSSSSALSTSCYADSSAKGGSKYVAAGTGHSTNKSSSSKRKKKQTMQANVPVSASQSKFMLNKARVNNNTAGSDTSLVKKKKKGDSKKDERSGGKEDKQVAKERSSKTRMTKRKTITTTTNTTKRIPDKTVVAVKRKESKTHNLQVKQEIASKHKKSTQTCFEEAL